MIVPEKPLCGGNSEVCNYACSMYLACAVFLN